VQIETPYILIGVSYILLKNFDPPYPTTSEVSLNITM